MSYIYFSDVSLVDWELEDLVLESSLSQFTVEAIRGGTWVG